MSFTVIDLFFFQEKATLITFKGLVLSFLKVQRFLCLYKNVQWVPKHRLKKITEWAHLLRLLLLRLLYFSCPVTASEELSLPVPGQFLPFTDCFPFWYAYLFYLFQPCSSWPSSSTFSFSFGFNRFPNWFLSFMNSRGLKLSLISILISNASDLF